MGWTCRRCSPSLVFIDIFGGTFIFNISLLALPRPKLITAKRLHFNRLVFEEGHRICRLKADKYLFFQQNHGIRVWFAEWQCGGPPSEKSQVRGPESEVEGTGTNRCDPRTVRNPESEEQGSAELFLNSAARKLGNHQRTAELKDKSELPTLGSISCAPPHRDSVKPGRRA
jgi:hypothetical protein